jgi:hypothetical protein
MSGRTDIDDQDERQFWAEGRAETRSARLELAREAGWGRVSWWSVMAGVLTVIGVMAVCVGVAAAALHAVDITTDTLSDSQWTRVGFGVGLGSAVVLFGCFGLGGYTAGRMARRAGARHGLLVFVVGVVVILVAIGIAQLEGALSVVRDRFDDLGAPTGESTWTGIALVTIGVALAGAFTGSLLGGARGERWHQRLVARAMDPAIGPEADLRAEVDAQREAAARTMERARLAGVIQTDEEPITPGAERDDGRDDDRDAESASTGAGPSTPPSSSS